MAPVASELAGACWLELDSEQTGGQTARTSLWLVIKAGFGPCFALFFVDLSNTPHTKQKNEHVTLVVPWHITGPYPHKGEGSGPHLYFSYRNRSHIKPSGPRHAKSWVVNTALWLVLLTARWGFMVLIFSVWLANHKGSARFLSPLNRWIPDDFWPYKHAID